MVVSPNRQQHLRDISVVVADSEGTSGPLWSTVRSRLKGEVSFSKKVTVPRLDDGTVVDIEIDPADPGWGPHTFWGIAASQVRWGISGITWIPVPAFTSGT